MKIFSRFKITQYPNVYVNLLLAIFASGFASALFPAWLSLPTRILALWDTGALCFLALTWMMMWEATPATMRRQARRQDVSRLAILSLIIAAGCVSILAIGFLLKDTKGASETIQILHLTLSILTIFGSWLLVHTIYALHYAHGYYQTDRQKDRETEYKDLAGGLDFPNDIEPDYRDFLYFSFVIGMTSQVSDVQISSRSMRQLALIHGILSFFFNTAIVAMTINVVAGLI